MTLAIRARTSREQLPIDAPCDVDLTVVLRNEAAAPVTIYPGAAKLGPIMSYAGIGIVWALELADAGGKAWPLIELRSWYGPPGNPPAPSWANEYARTLGPGEEASTTFHGCWYPNAALDPRHLAISTLDPQGMDRVARLEEDLAKASVLVMNGRVAELDRSRDDFLRGRVVGFLPEPRACELRISYVQDSWMKIGARIVSSVASARFEVG